MFRSDSDRQAPTRTHPTKTPNICQQNTKHNEVVILIEPATHDGDAHFRLQGFGCGGLGGLGVLGVWGSKFGCLRVWGSGCLDLEFGGPGVGNMEPGRPGSGNLGVWWVWGSGVGVSRFLDVWASGVGWGVGGLVVWRVSGARGQVSGVGWGGVRVRHWGCGRGAPPAKVPSRLLRHE